MIAIAFGSNLPYIMTLDQSKDKKNILMPKEIILYALQLLKLRLPELFGQISCAKWQLKSSSFYRSDAWPNRSDPHFYNLVILLEFSEPDLGGNIEFASLFFQQLQKIEKLFAKARKYPNAPRCLDIDLLFYNNVESSNNLILPHPRMHERDFVLKPLFDILPNWRHPVLGKMISQLMIDMIDNNCLKCVN